MRVLLWDFDGTLGYRQGMWSQVLFDVLREHHPSCTATREDIRPFLREGFPWHQPHIPHVELATPEQWWRELEAVLMRAYVGIGCPLPAARHLALLAHQKYLDKSQWFLYEDAIPTLKALSTLGWEHAILSNHVPELSEIIDAVGLVPHIRMAFSSALTGYEKPHPQAFFQALDVLGRPETIWMIGDNIEADVLGAQAVGIPGILVRKEDTRATYAFPDLSFISSFLSQR